VSGSGTVPAVNQIEAHPYFPNDAVRGYGQRHGIVTEAWRPLVQGAVLNEPAIARVARVHRRTPAQVVLRWHIQRGDVVFPKSVSSARMRENLALFDFSLNDQDMAAISALDRGGAGRNGPDPDTYDHVG